MGPAAELDGQGHLVARFVYGTRPWVPDAMVKGGHTYALVTDAIGSVRLAVDSADGTVVQRMDYDEFGRLTNDTNPGFQPFGFGGGLWDATTGLVRFGARDYDAETGRWTAKDPLLFGGGDTNVFSYCSSDPVNQLDPTGLQPWDWVAPHGVDPWEMEAMRENPSQTAEGALLGLFFGLQVGIVAEAAIGAGSLLYAYGVAALDLRLAVIAPSEVSLTLELGADETAEDDIFCDTSSPRLFGLGAAQQILPSNARTTQDPAEIFDRLERFSGIDPAVSSARLHDIKFFNGFGAADNVLFDLSGGVYDPDTRVLLGNLTEGGAGNP